MAYLVLVRHGQSEYNAKNLECGWLDPHLTDFGHQQAQQVAGQLKDKHWDYIFESDLIRSHETTDEIISELGYSPIRISAPAIKERNYGIYAGRDKSEVSQEVRRAWDVVVPEGENLHDVYNRVVPYYQSEILPKLQAGNNVIICAHGNSLRALVKYLNNISDEDIANLEIPVGTVLTREFN